MAVNDFSRSDGFLADLNEVLDPAAIDVTPDTCDRYARSTTLVHTQPRGVIFPETTEQVQQLVRVAGRHGVPLYPISRGRNWGYGSACAPTPGQLIVDLGRMNRIVEVNTDLAYAVIQPGVTQQQLYQYLQERDLPLWLDATGAGLEASLVGNTLDRGFGHTPYGDHAASACGMKVVLADGRVLDTGFGHYPGARAHRAYRHGVGPSLDGLFIQSNLGIVIEIGLWLMPKPENMTAFFISTPDDEDLSRIVDRLAPLRLHGLLRSAIHIANDLRAISARIRYPWERTEGQTPLPDAVRRELRRELRVGAWNVAGALYGPPGIVKETQRLLRKAMRPLRVNFVNDRRLAVANAAQRGLQAVGQGQSLGELLHLIRPVYGLLKGQPSDDALGGAAWRVRGDLPPGAADPLEVHAGLMWTSPVLPATGRDSRELVELMEPIYLKHGFEPLLTFTMISERAMICVSNLAFDVRDTDEANRAKACYDKLMPAMMTAGFIPYRSSPSGFGHLRSEGSVFWDVASQIKAALDPGDLISPGRYLPSRVQMTKKHA